LIFNEKEVLSNNGKVSAMDMLDIVDRELKKYKEKRKLVTR